MLKCVIFDCDGTLVDSEYLCNLALEIKLREYGVTAQAKTLEREFKGWKLSAICDTLEQRHAIRFHSTFVSEYRKTVDALFEQQLQPIPGVLQALSQIQLPMCVASSGPPAKIAQSLRLAGLADFFGDNVFSAYTVQSWKPEPGLFLHAASKMGFDPVNCVVIEDSEVGIRAALAAGMRALWFAPRGIDQRRTDVVDFSDMSALPGLLRMA